MLSSRFFKSGFYVDKLKSPNKRRFSYEELTQQTFFGLQYVLKTSSTRLQHNNFLSSKTSWRRLEDILQIRLENVFRALCEMSWRRLGRRKIVTLKASWRRLQDMSWRGLEDVLEINKMFTRISVLIHGLLRNLNQSLSNLYLTGLYFTNLRRIQNALIRTQ